MNNPFFKNHGPLKISEVIKSLSLKMNNINKNQKIDDIKDLFSSNKNEDDLTNYDRN